MAQGSWRLAYSSWRRAHGDGVAHGDWPRARGVGLMAIGAGRMAQGLLATAWLTAAGRLEASQAYWRMEGPADLEAGTRIRLTPAPSRLYCCPPRRARAPGLLLPPPGLCTRQLEHPLERIPPLEHLGSTAAPPGRVVDDPSCRSTRFRGYTRTMVRAYRRPPLFRRRAYRRPPSV